MLAIKDMKMPKNCFECLFRHRTTVNLLSEFHMIDSCFITKEEVFGHLKTRSQNCPLVEVGWTRSREEVIAKIDEYLKLPIEKQLEPINLGFYNALRWMVDEDDSN